MANYLSNVVQSVFGDHRVLFATYVNDTGAGTACDTGMNAIDYVAITPKTGGEYTPHYSLSGGKFTITTGGAGTSYLVAVYGR